MRKNWYRILALALCALMLLMLAPTSVSTSAADGKTDRSEARAEREQRTEKRVEDTKKLRVAKRNLIEGEPLSLGRNTYAFTKHSEEICRPFTPTEDGFYAFRSEGDLDPYADLLDDNRDWLSGNDDAGGDYNFEIGFRLYAGRTYYLSVHCLTTRLIGPVDVVVEKLPENACGTHTTWEFDSETGTLTISGSGAIADFDDGSDLPWASYRNEITAVVLPEGLEVIGINAFAGCIALTDVELPDSVEYINEYAFSGCTSLKTVTLPIALGTVKDYAFLGCGALTDVYFKGKESLNNIVIYSDDEGGNETLKNAEWHYLDLPCPHCYTYVNEEVISEKYVGVEDNLWHIWEHTVVPTTYCSKCGEKLSEEPQEVRQRMQQHYYDDDVFCQNCDHVNTCEHKNLESWSTWTNPTYRDTGDNREHLTSGEIEYWACCSDCGVWVTELDVRNQTVYEAHDYNEDGVCYSCGHVNTCKHANGLAIREEWDKEWYEDYDGSSHMKKGDVATIAYCPDCLQVFSEDWEYTVATEEHEYDAQGYCRKCGHKGEGIAVEGTVVWNSADVQFKGTTAYVIANGKAQTPRFTVKDQNGKTISSANYSYEYNENRHAGTGYVTVTFRNGYFGTCKGVFKIYLPATTATTVENVSNGIKLTWKPVKGAAGYVIYRRAWNKTATGWTDFVRWNNTTDLSWIDKTVYAGTRYQYGIKAYFWRRTDPVSGGELGGNVGDNYNLGEVGPLKTTVRITNIALGSLTAGKKQMTVKWTANTAFTGYEIRLATDKNFTKNVKTVKVTSAKTTSNVVKSLKSGTTYYVQIRAYHVFNGTTYFGAWSASKTCKVK